MRHLTLRTVGAVCALVTVACFVVGFALMATSGVQVLIPETGQSGLDWIRDVDESSNLFFAGAWLVVFGGLFGLVALIGFYDALREAGPVLIIAPIARAVGMTLVTISHAVPIAMAYELVPAYVDASASTQESLAVTSDTLAMICLLTNYVGNALNWGVTVPLYAFAILSTRVVPRWLGWLALFVGALGGWIGLLSPVSSVIEGITFPAFLGFFVWLASMGVVLLRRREREELVPAATS
jgi:hypothetical protein